MTGVTIRTDLESNEDLDMSQEPRENVFGM